MFALPQLLTSVREKRSLAYTVSGVLTTVCWALTAVPSTVPSFGVTSTLTMSPASPLPATQRSKVSVSAVVVWVRLVVPLTRHT